MEYFTTSKIGWFARVVIVNPLHTKSSWSQSKTTLNYQMMVERYPNLKEEVGSSNLDCESPLYMTGNLSGGQLPPVLWRWHVGLLSQKK